MLSKPPLDMISTTSPSRASCAKNSMMASVSSKKCAALPRFWRSPTSFSDEKRCSLRNFFQQRRPADAHQVGQIEARRIDVLEDGPHAGVGARLEHGDQSARGIKGTHGGDGLAHGRGVVGEVVHHGDPAPAPAHLLPAADAGKGFQRLARHCRRDAQVVGDGDRGQGVQQVVLSHHGGAESGVGRAAFQHLEDRPGRLDPIGLQPPE